MATPYLHRYDLKLCDYVQGTIAGYLSGRDPGLNHKRQPKPQPTPGTHTRTDPYAESLAEYDGLSTADKLSRHLSRILSPALWNYLISEERVKLLLTENDLHRLASAVESMPGPRLKWVPWPSRHRNFIYCLREMRKRLAPAAAEQFAAQSRAFGLQLEQAELTLSDGTRIVGDWVLEIRRNLDAMDRKDLLPISEGGQYPSPGSQGEGLPPELGRYVERIREKFRLRPELRNTSATNVCKKVAGNKQRKMRALKYLKGRGEFFGRASEPANKSTQS